MSARWIATLVTLATSFGLGLLLYPPLIGWLRRHRAGQVIQPELPADHQRKQGTPTAGGILLVLLGALGGLLTFRAGGHQGAGPAVAGLLLGGGLGLLDDLAKLRRGWRGIPARAKLPLQALIGLAIAWLAYSPGAAQPLPLPFSLGWVYWPAAVFVIVGTANAVNLTDGLDGLAGTTLLVALAGLVFLLPNPVPGEKSVAVVLIGALAAFLIFNRHPARVFMGDTGSLGLGFALAGMAVQQRAMLLLLPLGVVFAVEAGSVIIQVAWFKLTGGRRVFPMTPIHLSFRLRGWSENRVVLAFTATGLAGALVAALVARAVP